MDDIDELKVTAMLARLGALRVLLAEYEPKVDGWRDERLQLWQRLAEAGVTQQRMANASGVARQLVSFGLTGRRPRRSVTIAE
jgi:hypothetical protein